MFLIVGSSGLLGRYAAAYWSASGERVVCVSHRPGADIRLDLHRPTSDIARFLPDGVTHSLFCSSMTDIDACRRDPEGTRRFNVIHTINLLQILLDSGIQPIFCSSDLVFKGDTGNYDENAPRHPTTEYGRQKKEVEDFLLSQSAPFLIIRMTKLYSLEPDKPSLIGQILSARRDGTTLRCAYDQIVCPTCVCDIPSVVSSLVQSKAKGVYHVAAPQRYTRYTLTMTIAKAAGMELSVRRCSIRDFDFAEPRPADCSLNTGRLQLKTGFTFSTIEDNMPRILGKREDLRVGSDVADYRMNPGSLT